MSHTHQHHLPAHLPGRHHDFAAANKAHFDEHVENYELMKQVLEAMPHIRDGFLKAGANNKDATVLDFACGPGLTARELEPYVKSIFGVDISQGMVDKFNKAAREKGFPPEKMNAICTELKGEPGELDDRKFDIIICSMAYHHFASVEDITKMLVFFLNPSGKLMITDTEPVTEKQGEVPDEYKHIVAHAGGFSSEFIKNMFQSAGLENVTYEHLLHTEVMAGIERDLFIATGQKPAESK